MLRRRTIQSPSPDPRYSKAASSHGLVCPSSGLANGVPAPNKTAAVKAAAIPGANVGFINGLNLFAWAGAGWLSSLHRMLSQSGNPTMSNISAVFAAIKRALKVEVHTKIKMA